MSEKNLMERLEVILARYNHKQGALLPCLHLIQEENGYISEEMISYLAEQLSLPRVEVYSVVTFYSMFSEKKRGKYIIRLCVSLPCYLKGSKDILDALRKELKIGDNETTEDGLFSIETVSCLGYCNEAPVMLINERPYGNLDAKKAVEIIRNIKKTGDLV